MKEKKSNEMNKYREDEANENNQYQLIEQAQENENEKENIFDQLMNSVHEIVETQLSTILNNTNQINLEKTPTRATQIFNNTPKQYFTYPPKLQQLQQQYFNTANPKMMQEQNYAPNFSNQEQREAYQIQGNVDQILNFTDPMFNEKKKQQNFQSKKNIMETFDKTPERIQIRSNNQFLEMNEELQEKISKKKKKKQEYSYVNNEKQNLNINLSFLDPSKVPSPTLNLQQFASNIKLDHDPYIKCSEQNQAQLQTQELHQILLQNMKNDKELNKQVMDEYDHQKNEIVEQNNSTIEKININSYQNNSAIQQSEKYLLQEQQKISLPESKEQLTSFFQNSFQDMIQKVVEMYSQQKAELLQNQIYNLDKNYQQIQQNKQIQIVQPIFKQDDKILKMHKSILKINELESEQEKILQKINFLYKNGKQSIPLSDPPSMISFEEKNKNNFHASDQANDKIQQQYIETSNELNQQINSLQNMIGSEDQNLDNGRSDSDFDSSQNFKNQQSSIKSQPLEKHKLDQLMNIVISSYERNKNYQNLQMQNLSQNYTSQSNNNICGFQGFQNIQQFSSLANIMKQTILGSVNVDYPSSNSHILYNSSDSNGSNKSSLNDFNNSQKQNQQYKIARQRECGSLQDKRNNSNFHSSGSNNSEGSVQSQLINIQSVHNQKETILDQKFLKYQKQKDLNEQQLHQHQINSLNEIPNDSLLFDYKEKQNQTALKQMIIQQQAQSQINKELSFANDFVQISSQNQDVIKQILNQFQETDQLQFHQKVNQMKKLDAREQQELRNCQNEQNMKQFMIRNNEESEQKKQKEKKSNYDAQSKLIEILIQQQMEENPRFDFMSLIQSTMQELSSPSNQFLISCQSQDVQNTNQVNQYQNSNQQTQIFNQNNEFQVFQQPKNTQMLKK